MSARGDRRPILSNAFASDRNVAEGAAFWRRAFSHRARKRERLIKCFEGVARFVICRAGQRMRNPPIKHLSMEGLRLWLIPDELTMPLNICPRRDTVHKIHRTMIRAPDPATAHRSVRDVMTDCRS
jgi:hypothetical protein